MTDADDLAGRFDKIKATEADKPTTEQVAEYTALYDDLYLEIRNKIIAYRAVLTKIKHRRTYLKTKTKILKLAIEPGQMIITNRRGTEGKSSEWFHVDEVRGKKGYTFRGRLLTLADEGSEYTLFVVQSTTMRATEAVGWSWYDPKPISSVLGELVSSGINLIPLLEETINLKPDQKALWAFNKEKGWALVSDQLVKIKGWDYAQRGYAMKDVQLYTLDYWSYANSSNEDIIGQIKIEWPE